jgi:hypothetical protein
MISYLQTVKSDVLISPVAKSNTATASASLDTVTTRGKANYARIVLNFASEINTNAVGPTISLLHSDDTVVTNHATMVANRSAEDITTAKSLVYHVDLRGKKRYLRLTVTTATATNDDITVGATYDLALENEPASTSDMADAAVIV